MHEFASTSSTLFESLCFHVQVCEDDNKNMAFC